jgi:hypothetical protein
MEIVNTGSKMERRLVAKVSIQLITMCFQAASGV